MLLPGAVAGVNPVTCGFGPVITSFRIPPLMGMTPRLTSHVSNFVVVALICASLVLKSTQRSFFLNMVVLVLPPGCFQLEMLQTPQFLCLHILTLGVSLMILYLEDVALESFLQDSTTT